ncbi:acyltransferase family protein [Novosphingobium capsulatum]|uniref:acyltransferase family protein n=1 Tax=Novosphingobium capsulatum TaxID=13688 RepID=UPI00078795A9|nr:acyltransferase [Novosphingobium capsulatum]WQD92694.1 acyltransferase [Novosphingobium capsulatum]
MNTATQQARQGGRYALLDEMRGIAALAVCLFHIGTRATGIQLFPNGYLAVDFFFMLSGFVLAEAYEARLVADAPDRAPVMDWAGFARRRLVRIAPVAVLGAGLGGLYLVARCLVSPDRSDPLDQVLLANALNLLILPKLWHGAATGWELFPANGPLWSLFFEILANLAWAAFLVRRSTALLAAGVALAGLALVACALRHGTVDLGWQASSLDGGLARVCFGFGCGLLLHRLRHALPVMNRAAATLAALALVYALALPVQHLPWTLFMAMAFLPCVLVVAVAAGSHRAMPGGTWLGRISYPLYGIHVPLLAIVSGAAKRMLQGEPLGAWGIALVPPLLLAAWLVLTRIDEPCRAALSQWFDGKARSARQTTTVRQGSTWG